MKSIRNAINKGKKKKYGGGGRGESEKNAPLETLGLLPSTTPEVARAQGAVTDGKVLPKDCWPRGSLRVTFSAPFSLTTAPHPPRPISQARAGASTASADEARRQMDAAD